MALAYEGDTSLAFDTTQMKEYGTRYAVIAKELRDMAKKLDDCLKELSESGWTTPAGSAFHKMAQTNWEDNIEKYADLLDTLKDILEKSVKEYDDLTTKHIEITTIN
ncbi:MAG: WXG100 family type VII secretion target [Oscillospiraceae bacterium]